METLQKFFSDSWAWIAGIGAAIAAFFVGRSTAAAPAPDPSASANPASAKPAAPGERVVFKTGNVISGYDAGKRKVIKAEESGAEFTVDNVKYRITGYTNPEIPNGGLDSGLVNEGLVQPTDRRVVSGDVRRLSDGLRIATRAVDIKGGKFELPDEAAFRTDVKIANAVLKNQGFIPQRVVRVEGIKKEELTGIPYAEQSEQIRVVTIAGTYQGKTIERRIITYSPKDNAFNLQGVGAYNNETPPKPVFLDAKRTLRLRVDADSFTKSGKYDDYVRESVQSGIEEENFRIEGGVPDPYGIKEFFKRIAEGVNVPDTSGKSKPPVIGSSVEDLSKDVPLPDRNPNVGLPRDAAVASARYT